MLHNMSERNKERIYKRNKSKLQFINKDDFIKIPQALKQSNSLFNRNVINKNLSCNVFQRLSTSPIKSNDRKKQYKDNLCQLEAPFQPILCKQSQKIVERSKSKAKLSNTKMNPRSHSCFCLSTSISRTNISRSNDKKKNVSKKSISKKLFI